VIADRGEGPNDPGRVVQVDAATGNQTVLSTFQPYEDPFGIAIDSQGNIYVVDSGFNPARDNHPGKIVRVNPVNGQRALFLGPAVIATCVALILGFAFHLGPGRLQFALILLGSVGLAGTQGPMTAAIASRVHPGLRATAIAMLAVVQNIVGLAAGSLITGMLSDRLGIAHALAVVPLLALGSAVIFVAGARSYVREAESATAEEPQSSSRSPSLSPRFGSARSNTRLSLEGPNDGQVSTRR